MILIPLSDTILTLRSAEGQNFIVKNMIPGEYEYQQDLQKPLASCPNLRTVIDGLPGPELFIYPFLETDFLQFARKELSEGVRRNMLKSALVGLAAHERNIIHTGRPRSCHAHSGANRMTDIKPDNILLDYEKTEKGTFSIKSVQISDLEDSVILPPRKYLREGLCGNQLWRSPESWARSAQGTPSDIFSFGVVVYKPRPLRVLFCLHTHLGDLCHAKGHSSSLQRR